MLNAIMLGAAPALADEHDSRSQDKHKTRKPTKQATPERDYLIMLGELAMGRDDITLAAEAYAKALEYSRDPALAKRATQIALSIKRYDLAYKSARHWAKVEPDSEQAQQATLRLAFLAGDEAVMCQTAPRLLRVIESRERGYAQLVKSLAGQPDKSDLALAVARAQIRRDDKDPVAYHALGQLALGYGKLEKAARAADKARQLDPEWGEAGLLKAAVLVRAGDIDQALQLTGKLPGDVRQRASYYVQLGRMLNDADEREQALEAFQRAVGIDGDYAQARFLLGTSALLTRRLGMAAVQFEMLYQAQDKMDDAAYYRGMVAQKRDHYRQALRWYQRVQGGSHILEARVRMVQLRYARGDKGQALQEMARLLDEYPQKFTRLSALYGKLLALDRQWGKALSVYERALQDSPEDRELLYGRALVYAQCDKVDKARHDLEQLMEQNEDDADVLNAYGYLLASHGQAYDKAANYIRRALEEQPENPAFLDSLGWVCYKQERLEKAQRYLRKAHELADGDPEIAAHLGEVLWRLGKRDKARRIWHQALSAHPDNDLLKQTIKRLES